MLTDKEKEEVLQAMALPGFRWLQGMRQVGKGWHATRLDIGGMRGVGPWFGINGGGYDDAPFDPRDASTGGALLHLLGSGVLVFVDGDDVHLDLPSADLTVTAESVGWACTRLALLLKRWPGGLAAGDGQ